MASVTTVLFPLVMPAEVSETQISSAVSKIDDRLLLLPFEKFDGCLNLRSSICYEIM